MNLALICLIFATERICIYYSRWITVLPLPERQMPYFINSSFLSLERQSKSRAHRMFISKKDLRDFFPSWIVVIMIIIYYRQCIFILVTLLLWWNSMDKSNLEIIKFILAYRSRGTRMYHTEGHRAKHERGAGNRENKLKVRHNYKTLKAYS